MRRRKGSIFEHLAAAVVVATVVVATVVVATVVVATVAVVTVAVVVVVFILKSSINFKFIVFLPAIVCAWLVLLLLLFFYI
jgi:hypothetical protein